jgi:cytosine/adenosine deaminase-related metal-dependent hydrolase
LGDITAPSGTPAQANAPALDVTLFLELIAPTAARVGPALEQAQSHWARQASLRPWRTGLSPHAPYTVRPDLLAAVARFSAQHALPLAFHLAESAEEMQLLESGDGPLRDLLVELGAWQPGLIVPSARPVDDYLKQLSVAYRALVIHGNYLDDEAIALLHRARDRMSVVYCPRTHARFGHCRYRLEALLAAGVTVALGTDSRASSPDLSVLAEMRWLARAYPQLGRDVVLHMGTIWGARALGREQHRGTLEPGKRADLVAIRLPERDAADPYALWLDTDLPLAAAWIAGRVVYNSSSPS